MMSSDYLTEFCRQVTVRDTSFEVVSTVFPQRHQDCPYSHGFIPYGFDHIESIIATLVAPMILLRTLINSSQNYCRSPKRTIPNTGDWIEDNPETFFALAQRLHRPRMDERIFFQFLNPPFEFFVAWFVSHWELSPHRALYRNESSRDLSPNLFRLERSVVSEFSEAYSK